MGDSNAVELAINVDTEKAIRSIQKFEGEAKASTGGVEKAFGALKGIAVAAVAVFAGKQVLDFFSSGIEAANAQQQAVAQLGQQLQLTGEFSDEAVTRFSAFADEMERTSKFGDDVVLSQIAVAKSFGVSNDQAEKLVKGAIELSAATGDNLESSVKKLGLTFSGVTGKLDEQIPALKGLSKQALASGEAIDIVLKRFGGSAESEINTFAGATLQADNAFGNLAEAFGKVIIENPALIAAVKGVTDIFGVLQSLVEENGDAMSSFISGGVQVLAVAFSTAVDVVYFFVRGFEGLINVVNLASVGFLELASFFAGVWRETIGRAYELLLDFAQGVVGVIENIPGVGAAMGAMGLDADAASSKIGDLRAGLTTMLDDGVSSIDGVRDGMTNFAVATNDTFESVNAGFDTFQSAVDGASQKIFDADNKVADSGKKAMGVRSQAAKQAVVDQKELEKLAAEAQKLIADLTQDSLDEVGKISVKYREQLDAVDKFYKAGVIGAQQAAQLREQAEVNLVAKIAAIREKENQAAIEATKKAAEEQRKAVEEQAANPIAFLIKKIDIDKSAMSEFSTEVSLGMGALSKILDGKNGAKAMVADAAGAIGDAFMPGIGGAVGGIVSKLAEGPEATKEFIKGFVEGMPDIITAVAESMPVVVESLVDTLINEGGIIKIGIALAKAFLGVEIFKSIGKQLGIDMTAQFDVGKLGRILGDAFKGMLPDFGGMGKAFGDMLTAPVRQLFQGDVKGAIMSAFMAPLNLITTMLPASIRAPFEQVIERIKGVFSNVLSSQIAALKRVFDGFKSVVNFFSDIFDQIAGLFENLPGGGGGGTVSKALGVNVGFAEGGIVPSGFPNDSFPARLTSGERIIRPDDSATLTSMLQAFEGGSLGGGGNDVMTALLARILAAVENPMTVVSSVDFKGQTLANIMLQLSRQNARTA